MEPKFDLSSKIAHNGRDYPTIRTEYIKEFIRLLKEELPRATICTYSEKVYHIWEIIDNLAGKSLTEEKKT